MRSRHRPGSHLCAKTTRSENPQSGARLPVASGPGAPLLFTACTGRGFAQPLHGCAGAPRWIPPGRTARDASLGFAAALLNAARRWVESLRSDPSQRSFREHRCSPDFPRLTNSAHALEAPESGKASPALARCEPQAAAAGDPCSHSRGCCPHASTRPPSPTLVVHRTGGPRVAADEGETSSPRAVDRYSLPSLRLSRTAFNAQLTPRGAASRGSGSRALSRSPRPRSLAARSRSSKSRSPASTCRDRGSPPKCPLARPGRSGTPAAQPWTSLRISAAKTSTPPGVTPSTRGGRKDRRWGAGRRDPSDPAPLIH